MFVGNCFAGVKRVLRKRDEIKWNEYTGINKNISNFPHQSPLKNC